MSTPSPDHQPADISPAIRLDSGGCPLSDPHVERLYYTVVHDQSVDYENATPLEAETGAFRVTVDQGRATFHMKEHFATVEEAQCVVGPFAQSWEVLAGIEFGPDEFKLEYRSAEVVDREPSDEGRTVRMKAHSVVKATADAKLHLSRGKYPIPPADFTASPDAQTMFLGYKLYRKGRKPILSMAFMCLATLEASSVIPARGSKLRRAVAKQYHISYDILDRLGQLASTRGDERDARKASKGGFTPLEPAERTWIDAVVKAIILRVGEWAYAPKARLPEITMADFPQI